MRGICARNFAWCLKVCNDNKKRSCRWLRTQTVRTRNMQPNDNRKSMENANTLLRTIGKLLKRPRKGRGAAGTGSVRGVRVLRFCLGLLKLCLLSSPVCVCVCQCVSVLAVGRCENLILSVQNGTSPKSNKQTKRLLQNRCKNEDWGKWEMRT